MQTVTDIALAQRAPQCSYSVPKLRTASIALNSTNSCVTRIYEPPSENLFKRASLVCTVIAFFRFLCPRVLMLVWDSTSYTTLPADTNNDSTVIHRNCSQATIISNPSCRGLSSRDAFLNGSITFKVIMHLHPKLCLLTKYGIWTTPLAGLYRDY